MERVFKSKKEETGVNLLVLGSDPGALAFRPRRAEGRNTMSKRFPIHGMILGAALVIGLGAGYASAAQPHMDAAIGSLLNARAQLEEAVPNKGGHRVRAIELIDEAIREAQEGIYFANTH
jgi:hypothetical protein